MKKLNVIKACLLCVGAALFLASCETPEVKKREAEKEKEHAQRENAENAEQAAPRAPAQ